MGRQPVYPLRRFAKVNSSRTRSTNCGREPSGPEALRICAKMGARLVSARQLCPKRSRAADRPKAILAGDAEKRTLTASMDRAKTQLDFERNRRGMRLLVLEFPEAVKA